MSVILADAVRADSECAPRSSSIRWWVLASLFASGFMIYGAGLYAFILIVEPLARESGWSRAASGMLVTAFWISAPLALFSGPLLARIGPWRLIVAGIAIEAASLALLSVVSQFWQVAALRALMGFGKVLFAVSLPVTVARWFPERFSTTFAIAIAGWHVGGLALAPLTELLIDDIGWRNACVVLGAGLALTALWPAMLSRRCAVADGTDTATWSSPTAAPVARTEEGATFPLHVLRTLPMACLLVATVAMSIGYMSILSHQPALLTGAGFSSSQVALLLGLTAACAATGVIGLGLMLDRLRPSYAALTLQVFTYAGAAALIAAMSTHDLPLAVIHAVAFGLALGGMDIVWTTLIKRRFGDEHFGTFFGIWYFTNLMTLSISGAISGWLMSAVASPIYFVAVMTVALLVPAGVSIAFARSLSVRKQDRFT